MGGMSPELRRRMAKDQRGLCFYCQIRMNEDQTWEHLVSRASGGSNKVSNLRVAHSKCNSLVGCLPIDEKIWLRNLALDHGSDAFFRAASALAVAYGRLPVLVRPKGRRRPKNPSRSQRKVETRRFVLEIMRALAA
jgi:hypothetical protein